MSIYAAAGVYVRVCTFVQNLHSVKLTKMEPPAVVPLSDAAGKVLLWSNALSLAGVGVLL